MALSTILSRSKRYKWTLFITSIALLGAILLYPTHTSPERTLKTIPWLPTRLQSSIRIAKATISYTPANTRALALHTTHNTAFTYPLHVLRTPIIRGSTNPLLYLQHLIVTELVSKTAETRTEWILFFDASTILLSNAQTPLHMFVPSHERSYHDAFKSLTVIGTKDDSVDVDTRVFFVRVSTLSLRFLTLVMGVVYEEPEREWGKDIVGKAMQQVLEREEWRDKGVWVPREWWFGEGAMFKRVEGVLEMDEAFVELESKQKMADTVVYPAEDEVEVFWNGVLEAKQVLAEARRRGYAKENGEFIQEYVDVKNAVELWTWDLDGMRKKVESLKQAMHIGEVIGYEAVIE